ncbi:MAG: hypothetical protein HY810_05215 [Candidatus Omnitrophica bacterium]|nr:hypothetical protein [Candidatus Omnitrophota bacterium]
MVKNTSNPEIWHKIIKKFNQTKLNYVLVRGAALVIHGLPRSTLDMDIYVPAEKEVLNKLFKIADSLGLESEQKSILVISHLPKFFVNQWICFSYEGQDILDVFLASKKEFDKLYASSEQKNDKTISIRVAALNDIEFMKKKSGRPIDLADIESIKEAKKYKKIQ